MVTTISQAPDQGQSLRIDATGSRRRLQALGCLGWSVRSLAPEFGMSAMSAWRLQHGRQDTVTPADAAAIARLYDRLWDQRATTRQAAWRRSEARQAGWPPPLAWDDSPEDPCWIDSPAAGPAPGWERTPKRGRLTLAEQAEEVADTMAFHGLSYNQAALKLAISGEKLQKLRDHMAAAAVSA